MRPAFRSTLTDHDVVDRYDLAWRGPGEFACRLILDDLESLGADAAPTVLDIGCGSGLMGAAVWQYQIALLAGRYIGVEPDTEMPAAPVFSPLIGKPFQEAGLAAATVDLAYAAMVLEHVAEPAAFFTELARVLRPGGVFWGFTVDRRHYFSWASQLLGALRLKDLYLDRVRGHKGQSAARYDNYPTCYRCNSPAALRRLSGRSFNLQTWSLHRVGQLDGYMPYRLRRLSHLADRAIMALGLPGSVLVARLRRR